MSMIGTVGQNRWVTKPAGWAVSNGPRKVEKKQAKVKSLGKNPSQGQLPLLQNKATVSVEPIGCYLSKSRGTLKVCPEFLSLTCEIFWRFLRIWQLRTITMSELEEIASERTLGKRDFFDENDRLSWERVKQQLPSTTLKMVHLKLLPLSPKTFTHSDVFLQSCRNPSGGLEHFCLQIENWLVLSFAFYKLHCHFGMNATTPMCHVFLPLRLCSRGSNAFWKPFST